MTLLEKITVSCKNIFKSLDYFVQSTEQRSTVTVGPNCILSKSAVWNIFELTLRLQPHFILNIYAGQYKKKHSPLYSLCQPGMVSKKLYIICYIFILIPPSRMSRNRIRRVLRRIRTSSRVRTSSSIDTSTSTSFISRFIR